MCNISKIENKKLQGFHDFTENERMNGNAVGRFHVFNPEGGIESTNTNHDRLFHAVRLC